MPQLDFNCNQVPEGDDVQPITPGKYRAVIVETDLKPANEKGTVQLRIKWKITDGPFTDRHVTNYITYKCPSNQQAQDIGHRQIKNIADAVGLPYIGQSEELHAREHIIDIGHQTKKDDADFNAKQYREVKRCFPVGAVATPPAVVAGNAVPAAQPQPQPVVPLTVGIQPPPANNPKPPWAK